MYWRTVGDKDGGVRGRARRRVAWVQGSATTQFRRRPRLLDKTRSFEAVTQVVVMQLQAALHDRGLGVWVCCFSLAKVG